jgi:hypothetical protein
MKVALPRSFILYGGRGRRAGNRRKGRRRREEGMERRPQMREVAKEGVITRVGVEGKGTAEDTFANCFKDSCGDFLDRLPKQL